MCVDTNFLMYQLGALCFHRSAKWLLESWQGLEMTTMFNSGCNFSPMTYIHWLCSWTTVDVKAPTITGSQCCLHYIGSHSLEYGLLSIVVRPHVFIYQLGPLLPKEISQTVIGIKTKISEYIHGKSGCNYSQMPYIKRLFSLTPSLSKL